MVQLGYTKKHEERKFRGIIDLEECNLEEVTDDEEGNGQAAGKKHRVLYSRLLSWSNTRLSLKLSCLS
ncbi:hypothetical protein ABFS83_10G148000 [Erythranthe nasuta]